MATKIGTLQADLKLESAAFIRNLKKAADATARNTTAMQRQMAGLQKSFAAIGAQFKIAIAGFVSVAAVRSLANLGKQAIQTADSIGEAATRIGIAGEALQRFRFAAGQADVSTEALDGALRIFQKNLSTGKLKSQSFDEFIQTIRDAPTQIEKVRVAQEGLGKQFQTGLLLAAQSGEEFRKAYADAFVISDKALEAASELDNQWNSISNALSTGFDTGFLEGFAGALDTSQEKLSSMNLTAQSFGGLVGRSIGQAIEAYQKLDTWLEENLPEWLKRTLMGISGMGETGGLPTLTMPKFDTSNWDAIGEGVPKIDSATDSLGKMTAGLQAAGLAAADLNAKTAKSFDAAAQTYINGASQITSTLAGAFQKQKGFAIANAVMNVAEGVTGALKLPFPLNWAQVAAVSAAGVAQIAAIKSVNPGSSSRPSVGGGRGSSVSDVGGGGGIASVEPAQERAVHITLQGSGKFGEAMIRQLVGELNQALGNGTKLNVNTA